MNLNELRISDLNIGASKFPQLGGMLRMSKLMLKSCNISGKIPHYLAKFPELKLLYTLCPIILGSSSDKDGLFADHEDVKSIDYLLIS
ncbi:hypothetical protein ACS0TY_017844 [Phlomoides rotata]